VSEIERLCRLSRRDLLRQAGVATAGILLGSGRSEAASQQLNERAVVGQAGRPRASEFVFARLRYDSGDWDFNPKVAANVLNSIVEYTNVPVYRDEVVIDANSEELGAFPFLFMTGHKLVRFSTRERERLREHLSRGGLLFSDDCNHDIAGLYATSFEREASLIFPAPHRLAKLPTSHALYRSFFQFPEGPPQTSHELNGWGDDMVHDYLKGVETDGRLSVLYSNKDYGCEWD
jgi:hypothetical protein